jgi:hypothetical protein
MILYNKTILLPNLKAVYEVLNNNDNESLYTCKCLYEDRIAIKHYTRKELNIIQIWKTKSLFDWWYDPYQSRNFMATIDYRLEDTYIKIMHVGINDYDRRNRYNNYNCLDEYDSEDLIKNMVNFVKIVATKENKAKIILDVHENLRLFLKYYYYIGFKPTERKCIDNPFWIETELILQ